MLIFMVMLLILAVAIFTITTLSIKSTKKKLATFSDDRDYRYEKTSTQHTLSVLNKVRWIGTGVIVLVMVASLLFGGIKIVDETEIGVVKTFGTISGTIDSGLKFVNPLTQTVSMYDLRVHVKDASFASYTKDAQPLTASIEYQYALNASGAADVAREYGNYETMETKLNNVVEEKAKIVFARYSAMTLLENRSVLSAELAVELESLTDMFDVSFTTVVIKDIDFSDAFEASVEAKMTAEQAALKAEQDKKTAIVKAEQEKEVAVIKAEAAIAEAEGEARALEITRQALENMPDSWIQQQYLEKWDGKLPSVMAGDSTGLWLNPEITD